MNKRTLFTIKLIVSILFLLIYNNVDAQNRLQSIENKLSTIQAEIPALNEKINASVSDVPIQEFIRTIATNSTLNVSIDPSVKYRVTGNYNQVKVSDLILFLCKEYNLTINFTGTILSLIPYDSNADSKPIPVKKELNINYDQNTDLMSIDIRGDSLTTVMRKVTDLTKRNVILSQELSNQIVSGYIKDAPFETALDKFLYSNKLMVTKTKDNFFMVERYVPPKTVDASSKEAQNQINKTKPRDFYFAFQPNKGFTLKCTQMPLSDLIKIISDTLGFTSTIIDKIEGNIDLNLPNTNYENFLNRLFIDGIYSYLKIHDYYVFGKSDNSFLKAATIVQLQHRTVDKIMEIIPEDITSKLVIKEFPEQNSLIAVGNPIGIKKFQDFIGLIDQVVPVVLIEVLIVEISKSRTVSTGLSLGAGKTTYSADQTISGGVSTTANASDANTLFSKISGLGWINLGRVSSDFYLNVKALEEDGRITIKSTPKLATLNGHEASLSNGETKYYKEERSNYIGTQTPTLSNSYVWQSIKADLSITIKPIVSGNDQITLDISVDQSQFTPREFDGAPPGTVTRKFKSLIRVKNQEMILLGGLDKLNTENRSKGLPLIARIPILKWIFGSNYISKADSKLSIFIQPTVIY